MTTSVGKGLSIQAIAQSFLDGVVDHFAAAAQPLPERQYVAPGNPALIAWDCEQLVVSLQGIGWGQAIDTAPQSPKMAAQLSAMGMRHAILSIQLVRCTPAGGRNALPSVAAIQAAGDQYMRDAGLISQALVTTAARVRHGLDETGLVQPGVVNPLGPEGGYTALEATVSITAGTLT